MHLLYLLCSALQKKGGFHLHLYFLKFKQVELPMQSSSISLSFKTQHEERE